MNDSKRFRLLTLGLLLTGILSAQFQMGMRSDGYAGVSGLPLQPTSSVLNPFAWDVQLGGAGVFLQNNYGFLQNTGALPLLRSGNPTFARFNEPDVAPSSTLIRYNFVNGPRDRFFATSAYVSGPAATVKLGERHAVGFATGVRMLTSLFDLPDEFSYDYYEDRELDDAFAVGPFRGAAALYGEWSVNYAFRIPVASGNLAFGTTLKYLVGYEGLFAANRTDLSYRKIANDRIEASRVDGAFGFTNNNLHSEGYQRQRNGGGFAADLGVTYTHDGDYERPYLFRLDASLLDVGALRFRRNAEYHELITDAPTEVSTDVFEVVQGIDSYRAGLENLSETVLDDPTASRTGSAFTLQAPTRFYLAGDLALTKNWYLHAAFLQAISLGERSLRRGAWMGVTPRFQHRWMTVALPVGIYQYYHLNVGASVRAGFLTVGTDNLASIFGQRRLYGSDFYLAVRIHPFALGGGGKRGYGRRGRGVKCYRF